MYSHTYATVLLQERQRELSEAAERRHRTAPTKGFSRWSRRRPGGPRA